MRKLIAGFKMSLDGKIEGPEGYADWVESWAEEYGLTRKVDACLLGGKMYPGYENYWSDMLRTQVGEPHPMTGGTATKSELAWAQFAARTPHYVLSRSIGTPAWSHATQFRSLEEVADLKNAGGKDIFLMGGAEIACSCLDAGLLDELHLIIYPIVVGGGKSLIRTSVGRRPLVLQSATPLSEGRVRLSYSL